MAKKLLSDKQAEILKRNSETMDDALKNAQDLIDEHTGKSEIEVIKDMDWRIFQDKNRIKVLNERLEDISHEFAKALWPETHPVTNTKGEQVGHATTSDWSHHLMCMVVAEDPIAYLGKNI